MTVQLHSAPVLSTPETHIFEDPTPSAPTSNAPWLTADEIWSVYEVSRTAREILDGGWRRVALQFPDHMLGDAVRVFEGLEQELKSLPARAVNRSQDVKREPKEETLETSFDHLSTAPSTQDGNGEAPERHRLYILADTSYGACCVDEIAAEHVDAEVVVHYGRSCLSPTARLPVIYVFTSRELDIEDVVAAFEDTYKPSSKNTEVGSGSTKEEKVILMADIMYHSHIPAVRKALQERGWNSLLGLEVVHDPSSLIPNRKVNIGEEEMKTYSIFHISDPPPALLLTLSSRVRDLHIYPTTSSPSITPTKTVQSNISMTLRRRYALLTSLSTCGIFGILINTLSVKNYLQTVSTIKAQIEAAGKKSYTFVVGKVNAAKIANFSEIGGWVVIGCWESSLIESTEFYRPIITPFELGLALMSDGERVWNGGWRGDFEGLPEPQTVAAVREKNEIGEMENGDSTNGDRDGGDLDSEEESEPPEFDLRTGRYISHSRPMRTTNPSVNTSTSKVSTPQSSEASQVLTRRAKLDLATVNGSVSPGAEYLRSQRTWTGLGSDFHEEDASQSIEQGRSGVARGYTVGDEGGKT
jgi:diphthamide biosynthesis protein 2